MAVKSTMAAMALPFLPARYASGAHTMGNRARIRSIRYHKRAGRQEEGMSGILTSDLDLLCSVGIEYCCKLCDGHCDRCDLGKVFDSMLETNREPGESYAFMKMDLPGFDHVGMGGKKHA